MATQLINLGSTQAPYWEVEKTLQPNEHLKIDYVTDLFQLLSASAPDCLKVSFGGTQIQTPFSAGMGYRLNEPVQFIELWNNSAATLTIRFVLGVGEVRDSRLTVSGTVNTKIVAFSGFSKINGGTYTAGQSLTLPANSKLDIQVVSGSITVDIADTAGLGAVSVSSLVIPAGASWDFCANVDCSGTITVSSATYNMTISEV